jgi:hypothetical protein
MRSTISPSSGKRPSERFEKTVFPSTMISKTPPPDATSSVDASNAVSSSAARLAARGL